MIPGNSSIRRPSSMMRSASRARDCPRRALCLSSFSTIFREKRAEKVFDLSARVTCPPCETLSYM